MGCHSPLSSPPRAASCFPQTPCSRRWRTAALLAGGPRDAPARQQTIHDTIAWSYGLLGPTEQTLFRRLAVFAGGCTLESAQVVVSPDGTIDVLEGMASLVDTNLVRQREQPDGSTRFVMLETIRAFAVELFANDDNATAVRRAHADYVLDMAEHVADGLFASTDPVLLMRSRRNRTMPGPL